MSHPPRLPAAPPPLQTRPTDDHTVWFFVIPIIFILFLLMIFFLFLNRENKDSVNNTESGQENAAGQDGNKGKGKTGNGSTGSAGGTQSGQGKGPGQNGGSGKGKGKTGNGSTGSAGGTQPVTKIVPIYSPNKKTFLELQLDGAIKSGAVEFEATSPRLKSGKPLKFEFKPENSTEGETKEWIIKEETSGELKNIKEIARVNLIRRKSDKGDPEGDLLRFTSLLPVGPGKALIDESPFFSSLLTIKVNKTTRKSFPITKDIKNTSIELKQNFLKKTQKGYSLIAHTKVEDIEFQASLKNGIDYQIRIEGDDVKFLQEKDDFFLFVSYRLYEHLRNLAKDSASIKKKNKEISYRTKPAQQPQKTTLQNEVEQLKKTIKETMKSVGKPISIVLEAVDPANGNPGKQTVFHRITFPVTFNKNQNGDLDSLKPILEKSALEGDFNHHPRENRPVIHEKFSDPSITLPTQRGKFDPNSKKSKPKRNPEGDQLQREVVK